VLRVALSTVSELDSVRASAWSPARKRLFGLAAAMVAAVAVLAAAWLLVTALAARQQLNEVRGEEVRLRAQIVAGDLNSAAATAAAVAQHARRAHQLTTGPVWAVAAGMPVLGEPLAVVRAITSAVDRLGQTALPQLVTARQRLDPARLRRPDGSINLSEIAAITPELDTARRTVDSATDGVRATPRHTWLSSIDRMRAEALSQLGSLDHSVKSADMAARIMPGMLGEHGPKRYFVAFQNEAEARGTGGLPGSFAILEADRGAVHFTRFENDSAMNGVSAHVEFGHDYDQLYAGAGTTTMYGNGNLSPHFPYAAQIWSSMWLKARGEHLDGVIAVDPTALSYLLAVTGPAPLADKSTVSAENIVALTQSTAYTRFAGDGADNLARRRYLLDIARVASKKILDPHADTAGLTAAIAKAVGERRVLVWSADPQTQALLEATAVSGSIPVTTAPYIGLSIVNDGGNKLDYYLDRKLTWTRTGCGPSRDVTVAITLTNHAPARGLSSYVTGRSDRHSYPVNAGDNRLEVSYLASTAAILRSVSVESRPATAGLGTQRGHPLYTVDLELPRGTSHTIEFRLSEPAGSGEPLVLRQPLVRPLSVTIHDSRCD